MIKLFRKIRHKLIFESRLRGYLIYAAGEVVLVLLGILLALQFNNWNIQNENSKKEEWYLINIVEDIEYQKGALYDLKKNYQESVRIGETILASFQLDQNFERIDSLNYYLNILMEIDNFPNINNTYQELVNSGQQTLIQDKELSLEIIDYYLFCNDNSIDINNNINNIFYKEIYPSFYGLHQTLEYDSDTTFLNKSSKLTAHLRNKLRNPENILRLYNGIQTSIILNNLHLEMVKETIAASKELVEKIDEYLGLTPDMVNQYEYE